jgi:GT2 family glycosyltransferase
LAQAQAEKAAELAHLAREDAARAHAHAAGLEEQLQLIYASRSWKLTSPLRKVNLLMQSTRQVSVEVAKRGVEKVRSELRATSNYGQWLGGEENALRGLKAQSQNIMGSLTHKPVLSIVMPVHDTPVQFLRAAIDSVRTQWYPHWELCICDDGSQRVDTRELLAHIAHLDSRIKLVRRKEAGHIVLATNDAIGLSTGEFVVFLDHDDQLAPQALLRLVQTLNDKPLVDFIYSDEDKLDSNFNRCLPFFKPDWSPVLLWSQNYIGHIMCIRRTLLEQVGRLHPGTQGSQDHDLVLRLARQGAKFEHLPEVLYHWQMHEGSTSASADSKPYAHTAGKEAVARHLVQQYPDHFDRVEDSEYTFVYRARFKVPADTLASIIIPTRDHAELLRDCIESIRKVTKAMRFEIIVLDNGSSESQTLDLLEQLRKDADVTVVDADMPFNWSALNNLGRTHARGEVLVFLNNDTLVISPDWLVRLAEYALLPDVATVGALLLYPDGTIQHAGVVVGMGGWADHVFKGAEVTHFPSPFVSSVLPRNVLASTGACVAMATRQFDALGGFDEAFQICGSDVEIGLRAHKRGLQNVYLPDVRLYHLESKTRSSFVPQNDFEQSALKYAPYRTQGDPFFNPNLDPMSANPTPRYPVSLVGANG